MYRKYTQTCLLLAMILMPATLWGAEPGDTVLDVPRHLYPGMYRSPDVHRYDSIRWYNNLSYIFGWSPELIWNSRTSRGRFNRFSFGLIKEYSPAHAARLSAYYDNHQHYVGADLGYLWNLSNYYWGYDRTRANDISLVTGIEGGRSKPNGHVTRGYVGAYVGMHLRHVLTPHSSLFFEPRWGMYSRGYARIESEQPELQEEKLVSQLAGQIGYRYRLANLNDIRPILRPIPRLQEHHWFIDISAAFREMHWKHNVVVRDPVPDMFGHPMRDARGNVIEGEPYTITEDDVEFGSGFSFGLGYRGNLYSAVRGRADVTSFSDDMRLAFAVDYLFSLTNVALGENPSRHTDMEIILGPVLEVSGLKEGKERQVSVGGEWGVRMGRRLNSNWEIYAEPRWNFIKCYADDAGSLRSLNFHPNLGMSYTYSHRPHVMQYETRPLQNWYIQAMVGGEMATFDTKEGTHTLGNFEISIGRNISPLWGVRAGIFSGDMKSDELEWKTQSYSVLEYPMFFSYWGARLEAVMHFLRMWAPSLENSRWNWSFSAGMEGGQVNNVHRNDISFTAGSQIQYRATSNTWLTLGARYRPLSRSSVIAPLAGQLGVQYDFSMPKVYDFYPIPVAFYVQGGGNYKDGFSNSDKFGYNASIGMDFHRIHGFRLNLVSTKEGREWFGADYVYGITDHIMGDNPKRRLDVSGLAGLEIDRKYLSNGRDAFGFGMGLQADFHLLRHFSLFLQPRLSYTPWDPEYYEIGRNHLSLYTLFGVRLDIFRTAQ